MLDEDMLMKQENSDAAYQNDACDPIGELNLYITMIRW